MFSIFNKEGKGAIVFINQQSHTLNLLSRLKALKEAQKDNEIAKAPRIVMDSKDFGIGAQILHDIGISKIRLVSNSQNTKKRVGMIGYGLEITEYVNY
jgi:3,4-dihydroxy 2-butanone 4-phosphate synthase/GTP cyclohydrolase II